MPTYDYVCKKCGRELEIFQKMNDPKLETCPVCGKKALQRKIGAGAGIIFRGTGYYCTDFKNKTPSPSK